MENEQKNMLSRVTLRAMEPDDLLFLYEMENDMDIWKVGGNNVPYSRKMLASYIESSSGDIYTDKQVRFMVDNENGDTIGMVDLFDFSPRHLRAELGIVVKSDFRQQGYSGAIVRKVLDYARQVIGMHQIYAIVPVGNVASAKMLKSVGFQQSTVLKDWLSDGEGYLNAQFFQIFL